MQPHSGWGRKWHRFSHKHGPAFFMSFLVLVVVVLVALLMYMLTSINWRTRY